MNKQILQSIYGLYGSLFLFSLLRNYNSLLSFRKLTVPAPLNFEIPVPVNIWCRLKCELCTVEKYMYCIYVKETRRHRLTHLDRRKTRKLNSSCFIFFNILACGGLPSMVFQKHLSSYVFIFIRTVLLTMCKLFTILVWQPKMRTWFA